MSRFCFQSELQNGTGSSLENSWAAYDFWSDELFLFAFAIRHQWYYVFSKLLAVPHMCDFFSPLIEINDLKRVRDLYY